MSAWSDMKNDFLKVPDTYVPVPVSTAAAIADRFDKEFVVILSWDAGFNRIHTTTYGKSAGSKLLAAELGPLVAKVAGSDLSRANVYEDFRTIDAAEYKEKIDRLERRIRELGGTAEDAESTEGAAESDPDYGMRLPDGKTCGMCKHWGRCKSLIHDLDGNNRFCEFSPSRFVEGAAV